MTASGSKSIQTTVSSQGKIQEQGASFKVQLEGTVTVLEIDNLKRPIKTSLLVSKFIGTMNGEVNEREILSKDTRIIAQLRNGKQEFLINGNVASSEITEILCLLMALPTTQATDDDIFGTKERKKIGDSWALDSAKGAIDCAAKGMTVTAENIKGSTKIEKMVGVDGTKCLQINANIEMNNCVPPLPAGMTIKGSNMSATFSGEFPIDVSLPALSEDATVKSSLEAKAKPSPDAPEITLSMNMSESKHAKYRPIK